MKKVQFLKKLYLRDINNRQSRQDLFDRIYDYLSWNNPEKRKSCGIAQLDTILSETHGIILYRKETLSECEMPWMMQVCMLP